MKTRRSYFARTLAFVVTAACGMNQPKLAQAQSNEAQSGDDDVLSRASVWHDPEVPALGNPEGDVTLVEYFDYQCPVCRQLHPQLSRAVRDDGRVRLVSKGWPIFGGVSVHAARIALAAKYQGRFARGSRGVVHREGAAYASRHTRAAIEGRRRSEQGRNRSCVQPQYDRCRLGTQSNAGRGVRFPGHAGIHRRHVPGERRPRRGGFQAGHCRSASCTNEAMNCVF